MDRKPRLYLYDRREIIVLVLLGTGVAAFAFTLGVHLGKRVGAPKTEQVSSQPEGNHMPLEGAKDSVPTNLEVQEQAKAQGGAAEDLLQKNLQREVGKTGIRMDVVRPVELPSKTKAETKNPHHTDTPTPPEKTQHSVAASGYLVQVGSHPQESEAQDQGKGLAALGLTPKVQKFDVPGHGVRFRVFLGPFPSKKEAEEKARRARDSKAIEAYVLVPAPKP